MGGFVLHAQDGDPFPLNATQIHWLVHHGYVEIPSVPKREIWDKSKQDTFTKVIASFQVSCLIVHCAARAAQGLTIIILELNTLAIVVCALMTSYTWLHKSADVYTPIHIYSHETLGDVTGNQDSDLTPLDFIDENVPGYSANVQPFMRMPIIPSTRPIQRVPNDRFPTNSYGAQEYLLCFVIVLFAAIHVADWNFDFATPTERLLRRISSSLLFGITVALWIRFDRWKMICLYLFDKEGLEIHTHLMRQKTLGDAKRKVTKLPLPWEFATIAPSAVIYGVARLFLISEAFTELRNMNASAYANVEWTNFIPLV